MRSKESTLGRAHPQGGRRGGSRGGSRGSSRAGMPKRGQICACVVLCVGCGCEVCGVEGGGGAAVPSLQSGLGF